MSNQVPNRFNCGPSGTAPLRHLPFAPSNQGIENGFLNSATFWWMFMKAHAILFEKNTPSSAPDGSVIGFKNGHLHIRDLLCLAMGSNSACCMQATAQHYWRSSTPVQPMQLPQLSPGSESYITYKIGLVREVRSNSAQPFIVSSDHTLDQLQCRPKRGDLVSESS